MYFCPSMDSELNCCISFTAVANNVARVVRISVSTHVSHSLTLGCSFKDTAFLKTTWWQRECNLISNPALSTMYNAQSTLELPKVDKSVALIKLQQKSRSWLVITSPIYNGNRTEWSPILSTHTGMTCELTHDAYTFLLVLKSGWW